MGADHEGLHRELSGALVGASPMVLNALKQGPNEKARENARLIGPRKRGHVVERRRQVDVPCDGIVVDERVPAPTVDGKLVVDPSG